MIVVDEGDCLRLVTQPDHARFAAELLSLWRTHEVAGHARRQDLLFAVREHDNGWNEVDAAPRCAPKTGWPLDFRNLAADERRRLWERGILRYAEFRPYTALLIAQHAERLHHPLDPDWQDFFARIDERRQEWLQNVGIDHRELLSDYRWLQLADGLSLALCCRTSASWEDPAITAAAEVDELRLDPFPLAGTTTFRLSARRIPRRRYRSDLEVGSALAHARWQRIPVRVAPLQQTIVSPDQR
jgi:hypothetical protein